MLKVTPLAREFVFNGAKLPDPGPDLTVEEVRSMYVNAYPGLATATVEGPETINQALQYTFVRAVGVKG